MTKTWPSVFKNWANLSWLFRILIFSRMKLFILLALVVLATVYAEDEEATSIPATSSTPATTSTRTRVSTPWFSRSPIPHLQIRFYADLQEANQHETYRFNFAIAHMNELHEEDVTLYKQVWKKESWWRRKYLVKPKFNITLKTLDGEEFKQWWEENKKGKDGQTIPFPNKKFISAIIGDVNIDSVTCEDHHGGYELAVKKVRYIPHLFHLKVRGCP